MYIFLLIYMKDTVLYIPSPIPCNGRKFKAFNCFSAPSKVEKYRAIASFCQEAFGSKSNHIFTPHNEQLCPGVSRGGTWSSLLSDSHMCMGTLSTKHFLMFEMVRDISAENNYTKSFSNQSESGMN